jgi:hypothetical protein
MRIGAARDGDALTFQIGDSADRATLRGDERRPFRPRVDVDGPDRIAADAGQQRGRTRGRAKIDAAGIQDSSALLDPSDCTQRMPMPSRANSSSSQRWSLIRALNGL